MYFIVNHFLIYYSYLILNLQYVQQMSEKKAKIYQNEQNSEQVSSQTIDPDEIAKFSKMASQWWDEEGVFKPLHKFNPTRVKFIKDMAIKHFSLADNTNNNAAPLSGISILDVGCGGGLLAEPLARLGANVTAIDASYKNIQIATLHAKESGLDINYRNISAEELLLENIKFDIVLNMEVIEHVADPAAFIATLAGLINLRGLIFNATLNKTIKAYLFAIIAAEYVLSWLPRGTHDFNKFIKPSYLHKFLEDNGLKVKELVGVAYNPLNGKWSLSPDVSINYIMVGEKVI